jgi:multidrug efflux pump subunit AcrB
MIPQGLRVSRLLGGLPGTASLFGRAGAEDEDPGRRADPDFRRERFLFRVFLREGAAPEELLGEVRRVLGESLPPELSFSAAYPQDRAERLLGLSSSRSLVLRAPDREELARRLLSAREALAGTLPPGGLETRPSGTRPELRIIPRREIAALTGLSTLALAGSLYAATEGAPAGNLEIRGRPLEFRLSGDLSSPGERSPVSLLEGLPLASAGGVVLLGALGRIERREAEAALARLDRADAVYLDLPGPVPAEIPGSPPGLSRADESVFTRYRSSLILTVALVILLLYMTLAAQFESPVLPLILMAGIPFSLAGTGPALFLLGAFLDSGAVLGLVVLFGLVVNNGILLYEAGEEKLSRGHSPPGAFFSGARERLRPILITTLTTIFALLPLALSPRGASQRSMAAAMLGGIIASTLLCLFVLPPVFIFFFKGRQRRALHHGG